MRIFSNIIIIPVFSVLLLTLASCAPESCFEETEAFLGVSLYSYSANKILAPDSLSVWGLGHESVKIYNKAARISKALLPLNSSEETCTFIFRINGITDTLTINYSSYPHLVSKECGYTFYHNIEGSLSFSKKSIDSVYISKINITTLNEENIRLYY